jgi:hypothetical protein
MGVYRTRIVCRFGVVIMLMELWRFGASSPTLISIVGCFCLGFLYGYIAVTFVDCKSTLKI